MLVRRIHGELYIYFSLHKGGKKVIGTCKKVSSSGGSAEWEWSDKICVCDISKRKTKEKTCYSSCITFILTIYTQKKVIESVAQKIS